jgi:spectinomycin phosphotransferase
VLTEPRELDRRALARLLARRWGLSNVRLEYLPVGFGSHHWKAVDARGTQRFVTADDLEAPFQTGGGADATFDALDRAYRTAAALRDEGLEFVVAPLADEAGGVLRRLDRRYALSVLPFVEGEASSFGPYESAEERRGMGHLLGRLHAATARIERGLPRTADLALPSRAVLEEALRELDRPWRSGPLAEPARRLLTGAADAVTRRLEQYDALVEEVLDSSGAWVLTHGEPHRANVVRGRDGAVHLVDWDTTLIAPRERDLTMVLDDELTGWDEYRAAAGARELDERAMDLFRRWWELADICVFVAEFRRPHERTKEISVAWESLNGYLSKT